MHTFFRLASACTKDGWTPLPSSSSPGCEIDWDGASSALQDKWPNSGKMLIIIMETLFNGFLSDFIHLRRNKRLFYGSSPPPHLLLTIWGVKWEVAVGTVDPREGSESQCSLAGKQIANTSQHSLNFPFLLFLEWSATGQPPGDLWALPPSF